MGVALWRRGGSLRSARGRVALFVQRRGILTLKLENCLNAVVAAAAARSSLRQRAMVSAAAFSGHPRRTEEYGKALICNFGLAVRH